MFLEFTHSFFDFLIYYCYLILTDICLDTTECTDDWQLFAPFVAHDDMMQLSTDLHGLLPEFNIVDWIPSDPAPLPNLRNEERVREIVKN